MLWSQSTKLLKQTPFSEAELPVCGREATTLWTEPTEALKGVVIRPHTGQAQPQAVCSFAYLSPWEKLAKLSRWLQKQQSSQPHIKTGYFHLPECVKRTRRLMATFKLDGSDQTTQQFMKHELLQSSLPCHWKEEPSLPHGLKLGPQTAESSF